MRYFIRFSSRLCLLVIFGCLVGCIPAPRGKYYKPLYPDKSARYSGDECYGQAGAPTSLSFAIADGVTVNVNTTRRQDGNGPQDRLFRITFEIPTGSHFQFLSKVIHLKNGFSDIDKAIESEMNITATLALESNGIIDFAKISPTPTSFENQGIEVKNFSATTWLNFSWGDNFVPSAFSMEIPQILPIDAKNVEPTPLIVFAKAKKRQDSYPGQYKFQTSLIYATAESESALKEKYVKCLNDKSNGKCENILIYDEGGFKILQSSFKYSGRWYVYDVEKHSPFRGEISIQSDKYARWRFSSNIIRIIDSLSSAKKIYSFESFPLQFSYQVPITTPVIGVNNLSYKKATIISISGNLGADELMKYVVKLPVVQINGKRYEIAPIEFEKRVLDFGFEPFNC